MVDSRETYIQDLSEKLEMIRQNNEALKRSNDNWEKMYGELYDKYREQSIELDACKALADISIIKLNSLPEIDNSDFVHDLIKLVIIGIIVCITLSSIW